MNISHALSLSRSTAATIIKDKDRILEHVKGSAPMKSTMITKHRSGIMIEMERLLILWLEDQHQRCIPVSLMLIQEKAKRLFQAKKKSEKGEGSESEEFGASMGWFMHFKACANLHNLKVQGEAASGDEKAASTFPNRLAELIKEEGYCAEQVFNVDEKGLFWKHMPNRTYIAKEEKTAPGHKAGKERLTLLLEGNAAVKDYCVSKELPFKVLLVLDNAPGHPAHLSDFNPNVKVVYLPPNTTALLQPMDQGVIASFKAYYLRRTFAMARNATEKDKNLTLKDFWKSYNIYNAAQNIAFAWDKVRRTNLNGVWKKLCPQFVYDFHGFEESVEAVTEKVVAMGKQLNLDVEAEDVTELLASHGEELSAEDLIQLEKQLIEEEEIETPEPKRFTTRGLAEGFSMIEDGLAKFQAEDPRDDRFSKVYRAVMDALQCYRQILEDKKSSTFQTSLEQFFKKVQRPATDPVPSTLAASEDETPVV
ncbi:tigger transposable element-derived protein 1-like [Erpetoichthys calabaricus]|uniref:tigger transposable element-derived protein 1-like n=1 Tax=Erpetoichthys calabaricus TaxID=27687 RepID=UPI0022349C2A|nr:tigger transposable element-derived protein 1-like [Erpetoichthys calabaricus]